MGNDDQSGCSPDDRLRTFWSSLITILHAFWPNDGHASAIIKLGLHWHLACRSLMTLTNASPNLALSLSFFLFSLSLSPLTKTNKTHVLYSAGPGGVVPQSGREEIPSRRPRGDSSSEWGCGLACGSLESVLFLSPFHHHSLSFSSTINLHTQPWRPTISNLTYNQYSQIQNNK